MTYLKPLIALNNEGVRLYEQGRLEEAKHCFQQCIDEMFELTVQIKQATLKSPKEGFDWQREQSSSQQQRAKHSPIRGWSKLLPYTKRPGEGVFVFSRAIILRDLKLSDKSASLQLGDVSLYKLAILYNKALTHHQIACITVKSKYYSQDADMAFHLYEQAFQCCKSEINQGFHGTTHRGILMLALFNNVGVIFCNDLARFHDALECFKASCGVVLSMDLSRLSRKLDPDEMYLLSMNIWMAPGHLTPAA
eukprot:CAMPEP_0119010614 /NCGR_PEP_ID=MMETSP1176-20130426/5133_1 /TAXON_ID=265551 /ORGANISM="Synedropsis recta cf, Strain CCMP1620" /LENGTH=249 /DNA_ID=CAMNT_0006963313 /DNA_START=51 /DNA_END=800 /DNA_ORIENTATION=-